MENEVDEVKKQLIVEARAKNISHNVRCTECVSQSIEDSQADIAILLWKTEIFEKQEEDYGETILYAPKFDLQTAALWLSLVLFGGAAAGVWAYQGHKAKNNAHIMALNLVRSVPLTPNKKQTMLDLLKPPQQPKTTLFSMWRRWQSQ